MSNEEGSTSLEHESMDNDLAASACMLEEMEQPMHAGHHHATVEDDFHENEGTADKQ